MVKYGCLAVDDRRSDLEQAMDIIQALGGHIAQLFAAAGSGDGSENSDQGFEHLRHLPDGLSRRYPVLLWQELVRRDSQFPVG